MIWRKPINIAPPAIRTYGHIGEEVSERYEYIPAQMLVIEDACQKYACACKILTATKPMQPIEKSTASASRAGAGDREQGGRSLAAAPAGEDVPPLWR